MLCKYVKLIKIHLLKWKEYSRKYCRIIYQWILLNLNTEYMRGSNISNGLNIGKRKLEQRSVWLEMKSISVVINEKIKPIESLSLSLYTYAYNYRLLVV